MLLFEAGHNSSLWLSSVAPIRLFSIHVHRARKSCFTISDIGHAVSRLNHLMRFDQLHRTRRGVGQELNSETIVSGGISDIVTYQ